MGEDPERERAQVGEHPRGGAGTAWEVFVREGTGAELRHVGSVTAPDEDRAHERAAGLFARFAEDVWLCPATEVRRFSTHDLDDGAGTNTPASEHDRAQSRTAETEDT